MSAKVRYEGYIATCRNGVWTSRNKVIADAFNAITDPMGISPSVGNPDLYLAEEVIRQFVGAELLEYDEIEHVEGRTY